MIITPLSPRAVILPGITKVVINRGVTPVSGAVPVTFTLPAGHGLADVFVAVDGVLATVVLNSVTALDGGDAVAWVNVGAEVAGDHAVTVYAASRDWSSSRTFVSGAGSWNNYSYPNLGVRFAGLSTTYCSITNAAFNDTGAFTVACWAKLDVSGFSGATLLAHYDPVFFGWSLNVNSTPQVYLQVLNTGAGGGNSPLQSFTLGGWHLVVAGTDGVGNLYVSLDGGNYVTNAPAGATPYTGSHAFRIGSQTNAGNNVKGSMDLIGRWGRHLSQSEVTLLWRSAAGVNWHDLSGDVTLASLLTSLTAWYDCDDTGGQDLVDASGAGLTCLGQNGASTYTSVAGLR